MEETLLEVAEWVAEKSVPNDHRKYYQCPICRCSWWENKERHNLDCFVPRLKKSVELAQQEHNIGNQKLPPAEIEREYTFRTSEKNLIAFTETWEEHPKWWGDLPCLCSSCKSYGD
jgi:hypothetical protein